MSERAEFSHARWMEIAERRKTFELIGSIYIYTSKQWTCGVWSKSRLAPSTKWRSRYWSSGAGLWKLKNMLERQTRRRDRDAEGVEGEMKRGTPFPRMPHIYNIWLLYAPAPNWKSTSNTLKHRTKVGGALSIPSVTVGVARAPAAPLLPAPLIGQHFNPFNASCSKLLPFEGFSVILV